MAIKNTMFDDLDGTMIEEDGGGTVSFAIKGQAYEIELSPANQQKLFDALAPFVAVARKAGNIVDSVPVAKPSPSTDSRGYELRDARKWLRANGHEISQRGPVAEELLRLFEEANSLK